MKQPQIKNKAGQSIAQKFGVPIWRRAEIEIELYEKFLEAHHNNFGHMDLADFVVFASGLCINENELACILFTFGRFAGSAEQESKIIAIHRIENYLTELKEAAI